MDRQTDTPTWYLSRFGDDERTLRHRLSWRQIGWSVAALAIGAFGGLLLAAAWLAR